MARGKQRFSRQAASLSDRRTRLTMHRLRSIDRCGRTAVYSLTGLFLFILALQLLKSGAGGLKPVLNAVSADGVVNLFGFGWLGSYGVMSGSPVAAISLSLFSAGTISDVESFAMINGSRLGASFIVLFVGFLQYIMHRRTADGLYIGVVALLTAFTLWLPVLPLGIIVLEPAGSTASASARPANSRPSSTSSTTRSSSGPTTSSRDS